VLVIGNKFFWSIESDWGI